MLWFLIIMIRKIMKGELQLAQQTYHSKTAQISVYSILNQSPPLPNSTYPWDACFHSYQSCILPSIKTFLAFSTHLTHLILEKALYFTWAWVRTMQRTLLMVSTSGNYCNTNNNLSPSGYVCRWHLLRSRLNYSAIKCHHVTVRSKNCTVN